MLNRVDARELMDDPVESIVELERNLTDIEFANRAFGGIAPVVREVQRANARTLLDVCCGSGDVARALVHDARRRGVKLSVTALDRSEQMLSVAARRTPRDCDLSFVFGDAVALPFGDAAFDMVTCNLALHHFDPDGARAVLSELRRVARITCLVCDLRRSALGYAAALAWSRTFSGNRLTRNDAPLSVRRAYTPREARTLALAAGWAAPRVRSEPFFRLTVVDERVAGSDERACDERACDERACVEGRIVR